MSLLKKTLRALGLGLLVGLGVALFFNYLLADLIDRVEYLTYYQRSQWSLGDPSRLRSRSLNNRNPMSASLTSTTAACSAWALLKLEPVVPCPTAAQPAAALSGRRGL